MNQIKGSGQSASTHLQMTMIAASLLLAAFLWLFDSLFVFLWIRDAKGAFLPAVWPLHDPHELLMRIIYCSVLILTGIVVGKALQRLAMHQRETAKIAENLRITLDSIGDAVIAADGDGRITRMNPIAETLTGWTLTAALHRPLAEVFHIVNARTRQLAFNPVNHVLESGEVVGLANDTILIAKDGTEHQIADSAAPIRDSKGNITGVVLVFRDVTVEYWMRKEMEHTNALLKAVVEQSHIPMVLATADEGRIRLINQACLDFFGVPDENLLNERLHAINRSWRIYTAEGPPLQLEMTPLVKALRGEATHAQELRIEDKDGNIRYTLAEGVPIRNSEGAVIAGLMVFPDTTERKNMENERKKLQKLESIGTLAGGIAHDFNNILMGVFGGIELAKMTLPREHESYKYIEIAHQALGRATHLTKQLLTFAKGGEPLLELISLRYLINDSIQFNLSGSNINAHFDLPADLWPVFADKGQISHVLANLIINARQAMPDGGNLFVTVENVEHAAGSTVAPLSGDCVRISIRDEGIGISEKIRDKIFDPYFSTKQSGSGLGLAIVHSIISKHNGRIHVDSIPDVGSTFTLYLPADRSSAERKEPWYASVVSDPKKCGRVLIMDDDATVREIASEMLGLLGYEVEGATDGESALEKYAVAASIGHPFDCVIMDLTIPGCMGGKEAVGQLLAKDPHATAIVASGYSTDPVMASYRDYGFKGRLVKPFQLHHLKQELIRVFGT
jgi:PAS domain S-box-containing protein